MGYEGLSIDVTLSPSFLVPYVQITYQKKAPSFASVDNIEEKLQTHFGKIYTDYQLYEKEVLQKEDGKYGTKVTQIETKTGAKFDVHKVNVYEKDFSDRQFYLQSILSFFIDGASAIELN